METFEIIEEIKIGFISRIYIIFIISTSIKLKEIEVIQYTRLHANLFYYFDFFTLLKMIKRQ